ncbi:MAG: DUF4912 domain-containing protein [Bacillota bacterium]|jgi:hypothetical protein
MLIITYFLIFVLLISLIIILTPYFNSFLKERRQYEPKTSATGTEEFSEEFSPGNLENNDTPMDYTWKGSLIDKSSPVELPKDFGDEELALLVKNSSDLYAYWESTTSWGDDNPVLRVYEVISPMEQDEMSVLFDININREADNWFFQVPKDNSYYCVELGRRKSDGSFIPVLRSNIVKTPRSSLSTAIDENWIPCDIYGRLSNISYGLSSGIIHQKSERID